MCNHFFFFFLPPFFPFFPFLGLLSASWSLNNLINGTDTGGSSSIYFLPVALSLISISVTCDIFPSSSVPSISVKKITAKKETMYQN